nr:DNA internalization-related competence protein ComEC/Rec2 [Nitrosomonas sp. HPC101]
MQQPVLPELYWAIGFVPVAMVVAVLFRFRTRFFILAGRGLLFAVMLGAGFFWAALWAQIRLADELPHEWEGRDISVVGVISEMPQFTPQSMRFQFEVERVLTADAVVPEHVQLSWYRDGSHDGGVLPRITAGERWQLTVRLKRPHGSANPHVLDYEARLLERNVRATGYVRAEQDNKRPEIQEIHPAYFFERKRDEIRSQFQHYLAGYPYAGVLVALTVGDQRAIPSEQWETFARTGTTHLMAISGSHITLLAGMVFLLMYRAWRYGSLSLWLPARKFALVCGLIVAIGYALLAGFAVPVRRALFMMAIIVAAFWGNQRVRTLPVLGWVLLLVVVLDPWSVIAPGFWLSFAAVALICLVISGRIGQSGAIVSWMRIQWAITLGLFPLLLILFQQISLISPIANAVAIPVITFIIVPLALLATIPGLEFLLLIAHPVLQVTMMVLHWLGELPLATWQQHAPPLWTVIAAIAGVIWLLLPGGPGLGISAGFPARWLGILAGIPLFLIAPEKPAAGELWLTVLDVGQGLSVVVRTRNHAMLYDTGPRYGESDSGKYVILPFLRGEGIQTLDKMIVSHVDSDHSGGALSVLAGVKTRTLLASIAKDHPIRQAVFDNRHCLAGDAWWWDGVYFEILHPLETDFSIQKHKTNEMSCVIKITSAHGSVLLPGDIGKKTEAALLDRAGNALVSNVLVVPHHGSRSSSSPEFVRQVNPDYVIFTVGYRSRFGHPHPEIVELYREQGGLLRRSDHDGAILLRFVQGNIEMDAWRELGRRFWHDRWSAVDGAD